MNQFQNQPINIHESIIQLNEVFGVEVAQSILDTYFVLYKNEFHTHGNSDQALDRAYNQLQKAIWYLASRVTQQVGSQNSQITTQTGTSGFLARTGS